MVAHRNSPLRVLTIIYQGRPSLDPNLFSELSSWVFILDEIQAGPQALQVMRDGAYDLLFIDQAPDEAERLAFIQAVLEQGCQAPIILLTPKTELAMEVEALQAGAAGCLGTAHLSASTLEHVIVCALHYAEKLKALQEQRHLAEALHEVTVALNSTLNLDELLKLILATVERVVPHDAADIMLIETAGIARMVGHRGYVEQGLSAVTEGLFRVDQYRTFRQMMETGVPLLIPDTHHSDLWIINVGREWMRSYIGAPIHSRGEIVGFLNLASLTPNFFTGTHLKQLQTFAAQVGVGISNARSLEAERKQREIAETLHEATAALITLVQPWEAINNILVQLARVVPYDSASIFLLEGQGLKLVAGRGLSNLAAVGQIYSLKDEIFFIEIRETRQPIWLGDAQADPRFHKWGEAYHTRGWMAVPLIVRGQVIGCLTVDSRQVKAYGPGEATLVQTFANQAAMAMANTQLFEQTQQSLNRTEALYRATRMLIGVEKLTDLLQAVADGVAEALPAYWVTLILIDLEKRQATHFVDSGANRAEPFRASFEELWEGLTGWVLREHKPALSRKDEIDPREAPTVQRRRKERNTGSVIVVPLRYRERTIGTLTAANPLDHPNFTEQDVELMTILANQAAVAVENVRLLEAERSARQQAEFLREQTRQTLTQTTRLYELSTEFVSALSVAEVAHLVIEKVVQATQAHSAIINLLNEAGDFEEAFGPLEAPPRPEGSTRVICRTGEAMIVNDIRLMPGKVHPQLIEQGIRASIGIPLKTREQTIGALFVRFSQPRQFSQREVETLFIFANQAAIAIQNARLYQKVQHYAGELEARVAERTFELQALYELAQALGHVTQFSDVMRLILLHLFQTLPHDVAASLLVTETAQALVIQSQRPLTARLEAQIQQELLASFTQLSAQALDETQIKTYHIRPGVEETFQPALNHLGSTLVVPILMDGVPAGLLLVATESEGQLGEEQRRLLTLMADQAAGSIKRLQLLIVAEYQRLERLVAHLPVGLMLLNVEQRLVLFNHAARNMLAPLAQADLGDQLTALGQYPLQNLLKTALTGSSAVTEIETFANRRIEITARPITSGPERGGYILITRDVTDERLIQKRIQRQERMAAIGQLAAGIAHDFNNILTSIIGFAELLQLNPGLPESAQGDLERITKQGQRAARLVRQILDFSSHTITEKRPLDLAPFLKEMIKLLERTIPEDIRISLTTEIREYPVMADLTQLQQAITNLALNARDAMPEGGHLQFRLSYLSLSAQNDPPHPQLTPGQWIKLSVTDTGTGIPAELHAQIFEPFFTTKPVGQGTGLGLAQVYGIIKQHDGYIYVESEVGAGATFNIYLPAFSASGSNLVQEEIRQGSVPHGNNELVLLVEDDASVRYIGTSMLKHLGYRVLTATQGQEALAIYEAHQDEIKVVLSDMTMPEMGGPELASLLYQKQPAIKVVMLTGYPLKTAAEELKAPGVQDWLQKPLKLDQLAQTLNRLLA